MKKQILILPIILICSFSGLKRTIAQRVEKSFLETFSADTSTLIEVDSKFGTVKMIEWDEDSVEVAAEIWVESNSRETAEKLLSSLDAEISKQDNRILIKSILPSKLNAGRTTTFRIDFTIHAPADLSLDLTSKYGSVFIERISGRANLSVAYGSLNVQEMTRTKEKPLNSLNLSYSSGNIEEAGWLKLDISYSKLSIEESQALIALSKYSGLSVEECSSIVLDSKYDSYTLGELNNLLGEMKFSNLKIDELEKKLEIESSYTSVKVAEIGAEFEAIKIDNSWGGYKLGVSGNSSFTFRGVAKRGDISVSGMENLDRREENSDKYYEGTYGGDPKSNIDIQVKEGSVKIDLD